jgi:hypothetical protein
MISTIPEMSDNDVAPPSRASRLALAVAVSNTLAISFLIGLETLFVVLSLDWSLAGLFQLGPAVYLPLGALMVAAAGWLTVWVFRRAWEIELRLARDGEGSV